MSIDLKRHIFGPTDGEKIYIHDAAAGFVQLLADPVNTGETNLSSMIQALNEGAGVPVHHHKSSEQILYILTGKGRASLEGEEIDVTPGMLLHIPKGADHSIKNTGKEILSFLEITSPPGFENSFRQIDKLSDPDPETLVDIRRKHDIHSR